MKTLCFFLVGFWACTFATAQAPVKHPISIGLGTGITVAGVGQKTRKILESHGLGQDLTEGWIDLLPEKFPKTPFQPAIYLDLSYQASKTFTFGISVGASNNGKTIGRNGGQNYTFNHWDWSGSLLSYYTLGKFQLFAGPGVHFTQFEDNDRTAIGLTLGGGYYIGNSNYFLLPFCQYTLVEGESTMPGFDMGPTEIHAHQLNFSHGVIGIKAGVWVE